MLPGSSQQLQRRSIAAATARVANLELKLIKKMPDKGHDPWGTNQAAMIDLPTFWVDNVDGCGD